MGDIPAPVNEPVKEVDTVIHGIFYGVVLNAVKIQATAAMPFLGYPLISSIFSFALNQIGNLIYKQLERYVAFSIIDQQVGAEKQAMDAAVVAYKAALASGDQNAIAKTLAVLKAAAAALIRFDGSQPKP